MSESPSSELTATTPWLHRWAILTALVTLPLVFLGAEVTTKQVGMVDPAWPTAPWYLFGISWADKSIGFLIEHMHRLAGYAVGICMILLLVGLWRWEKRAWLRWLGVAALTGIVIQGLLGGARVLLNIWFGTNLALIHGCFGQVVFALLVSLAICTSRHWATVPVGSLPLEETAGLRRWSLIVVGLLLMQLVLGAFLRHKDSVFAQRGHLLVAFAVVALITWLGKVIHEHGSAGQGLGTAVAGLAILLGLQLLLGVEAWMVRFASEPMAPGHWLWNRDLVRSAHVLLGSLLLATAVAIALEAHQRTLWAVVNSSVEATGRLEGAA